MSLTNTVVKATLAGDGANTTFAIPFAIIADQTTETVVYIRDTTVTPPTQTLQVITTDYTLTGGPPATDVEFVTAPLSTDKVVIIRQLDLTQPTTYNGTGPFPAASHELALDRMAAQIQQLDEILERAPKMQVTEQNVDLTMEEPVALQVLTWDATGTKIVNLDLATVVDETVFGGKIDDLITLSGRPANSTDLSSFTGTIITDNVTVKVALQELETQLDTNTTNIGTNVTNIGTNATDIGTNVTAIGLNTAKVTNATHTGEVTGSGVLTLDSTAITNKASATVASGDTLVISDLDDSGNLKEVTAQAIADLGGGGGANTSGKNYVINSGFDFWQRGTTANTPDGYQTADRFQIISQQVYFGKIEQSQVTDSPNLDTKFCLNAETTAAVGANANNFSRIQYHIEGFDYNEIINKATVLTFYVKSNVTGIKTVVLKNANGGGTNRSYVSEYTISVADTWEKKTITVAANGTLGVGSDTNGTGMIISWMIGNEIAAIDTGTTDTWLSGNFWTTANHVDHNSINDYVRITQVKLEAGSTATDWDRAGNNIQDELAMCQRYFQKSYDVDTSPGNVTGIGQLNFNANGTTHRSILENIVSMPLAPAVTLYNPSFSDSTGTWRDVTAGVNRSVASTNIGETVSGVTVTASVDGNEMSGQFTKDAELT